MKTGPHFENTKKILYFWEKYTLQPADLKLDFFESGGDSLSAINMIFEIQKLYQIEISLESFMRNPTLQYLLDNICNTQPAM